MLCFPGSAQDNSTVVFISQLRFRVRHRQVRWYTPGAVGLATEEPWETVSGTIGSKA